MNDKFAVKICHLLEWDLIVHVCPRLAQSGLAQAISQCPLFWGKADIAI